MSLEVDAIMDTRANTYRRLNLISSTLTAVRVDGIRKLRDKLYVVFSPEREAHWRMSCL